MNRKTDIGLCGIAVRPRRAAAVIFWDYSAMRLKYNNRRGIFSAAEKRGIGFEA